MSRGKALKALLDAIFGTKPKPTPSKPPAKPPGQARDGANNRGSGTKRGTPCAVCKKPNRRHDPCKTSGKDPTKENNTMVDPDVAGAVNSELDDIIAGNVEKVGEYWTTPSGRRYSSHDSTLFPVDGPGLTNLNRMQHQVIKQLNSEGGLTGAQKFMDAVQAKGILTKEQIDQTLNIWKKCNK